MTITKGDVYDWNGVTCYVKRVSKEGSWADSHRIAMKSVSSNSRMHEG